MKRKSFLIFASILVCICCILGSCVKNEKKTNFVGMEEETTETCLLGSIYNLKEDIEDEDGNVYDLDAIVKTVSGERVGVFENSFSVDKIEGYKITYVVIAKEGERNFIVNLNVKDELAPSITINKPSSGEVNELYTLPKFSVANFLNGELTISVGKKDEAKIEITKDTNGEYTFTPESKGIYEISIKAVKDNGKQDTKTVEMFVDGKLEEGEIFYPSNPSMIQNISFKGDSLNNNCLDWSVKEGDENEKEYKLPYVSIKSTGTYWDRISNIVPRQVEEYYAQFNLVEMWVYFASTSTNSQIALFNTNIYTIPSNKWTKIVCTMLDFMNNLTNDPFLPFKFNDKGKPEYNSLTEVRLGNIRAFNGEEQPKNILVSVNEENEYMYGGYYLGGDSKLDAKISNGDKQDLNYTKGYLSVSANNEGWGRVISIKPNQSNKDKEHKYISMWVKFTSTSPNVQIAFFNTDIITIPSNTWTKIYLDKDKFLNCKDNYIPWKNHSAWDKGKAITQVCIGEIALEDVVLEDNLIFRVQDDLSFVYGGYAVAGGANIQASIKAGDQNNADYKGAYLSCVPTVEQWGRIQRITAHKNLNDYTQNTIKVWIYIKSDSLEVKLSFFNTDAKTITSNKWIQVSLDMQKYKDNAGKNDNFLPFKYQKDWNNGKNITEIRIGDIIAE